MIGAVRLVNATEYGRASNGSALRAIRFFAIRSSLDFLWLAPLLWITRPRPRDNPA